MATNKKVIETYVLVGHCIAYPIKGTTVQEHLPELTGLHLAHPNNYAEDVILSSFYLPRVFDLVKAQLEVKAKSTHPYRVIEFLKNNSFEVDMTWEQLTQRWSITHTELRRVRNVKRNIDHPDEVTG